MKIITITANDAGRRIERFLQRLMPNMPQSFLYKSIRKKCVRINSRHAKEGQILHEGDEIRLYIKDEFFPKPPSYTFMAASPNINAVYEDENIIILNKPVGVDSVPGTGDCDSLVDRILYYLYKKGEYNPTTENIFRPALCNRLDKNTNGLVIAAKNALSLRIINEKIRNGEIQKYYRCVVSGILQNKSAVLEGYITKNTSANKSKVSQVYSEGAKSVTTKYRVIEERNNISVLEIELLTGRSHQIRAHMASIGHPLLGDVKYGGIKLTTKRSHQLLCAYKLAFSFTDEADALNYLNGREFVIDCNFDNITREEI